MTILTGVGWYLSAAHKDRLTGEVHGHTWEVTAWHNCPDNNDAVILQNHLKELLSTWDHTMLEGGLERAENLARAVLQLSPPTCVAVDVSRPIERLYARVTA